MLPCQVLHDDASIADYVHLTRDGALVAIGDRVRRGDIIGLGGDTGSSAEPRLHFHVQRHSGCETVPVTFLNTRPQASVTVAGEEYAAESY